MGFLKSFFKLFSKNIAPGPELDNYLVYFFPVSRGRVRVNARIEIQPNFNAIVVINGKITDVLSYGKHRVNGSTMPVTFKNLKLGRPSKRGNYKNWFKAAIYYVNLKRFLNFNYESNDPFYIRSDKFGRVKGYSEGICHVTITDSEAFINYLLRTTSKIKPNYVKKKLSSLIGNVINRVIEKSRINFLEILVSPEKINTYLNSKVNDKLSEYGISLENVQLNSLKLTKKMQKKVNLFLSNKALYSVEHSEGVDIFEEPEDVLDEFDFHKQAPVESFKQVDRAAVDEAAEEKLNQYYSENTNKHKDTTYEDKIFERKVLESRSRENFNNENNISEVKSVEELNPIFKRRMGGQPVNIESGFNIKNENFSNANLDTQEVLGNSNSLKQCKYCGKTIETHYKFCPLCGFKQ